MQNGQVFAQLPYNYYNTHLGTTLADPYYLGKILYPAACGDIDPAQKADEIYQDMLGQLVYTQMAAAFSGLCKLNLGMP